MRVKLEVTNTLDVPIDGVVSDGQQSIRKAVGLALPIIKFRSIQTLQFQSKFRTFVLRYDSKRS